MCHSTSQPYTGQKKAAFSRANAQEGVTGVHILASFIFMADLCKETCYSQEMYTVFLACGYSPARNILFVKIREWLLQIKL